VNEMDCIFITNDDGLCNGLESLITDLHAYKIPLFVVVPSKNKSACSMSISLREKMRLSRRKEVEKNLDKGLAPLRVYTLEGTPADCSLFVEYAKGTDVLGQFNPVFAVSGINHGANLSHDILHSGTVGGARQCSMSGIPSIASSYCEHGSDDIGISAKLTAEICFNLWFKKDHFDDLEKSFYSGNLFLNLNIPKDCNGIFKYGLLGIRDYKNALMIDSIDNLDELEVKFDGPNIIEENIEKTDVFNVNSKFASISLIPTWPYSHPRFPNQKLINSLENINSVDDLSWIFS
tara:strand:+ start:884 stop:1756 length:873 start_codon:yes stop_codon:yes gene_type:complete